MTTLIINCKSVDIDNLIAPTILELNRKGYKTLYCCSGHDKTDDTYIAFDEDYIPKDIPKGFYLEDDDYYKIHYPPHRRPKGSMCIRSTKEHLNNIVVTNNNLYNWAISLPSF